MRCVQFRTALSARLDGEPAGVPDRRLDKHVARCEACREWLGRAEGLRGVRPAAVAAGPSADWTAGLLTRLGAERSDPGRAGEVRRAGADGVGGAGAADVGGAGTDGFGAVGRTGQGYDRAVK
ncbi:zf-HC2 domain-containing protein [Kitasatospora sp. NBC_01560]|uniref:zf-HC2 domain-containing protein n=1 Tax=Kitasatospora sp. NBC_01560 TaxID=2975965 RepID=UPI00386325D3